jgi:hypothetical protein
LLRGKDLHVVVAEGAFLDQLLEHLGRFVGGRAGLLVVGELDDDPISSGSRSRAHLSGLTDEQCESCEK